MFRAAVSDIDASEGWVKCGRCRKVFDCREHEIKPADFISQSEPVENDSVAHAVESSPDSDAKGPAADEFVPQISLFEESEEPVKSAEERSGKDSDVESAVDQPDDSRFSASHETKSAKTVNPPEVNLPSVEQKSSSTVPSQGDDGLTLRVDKNAIARPATDDDILQANRRTIDATINKKSKKENPGKFRSKLKSRLNITKPQAHGFSSIILAKAQSWKKQRNRFKKTKAFPYSLIAVILFAALIWQIAIVNYAKLSHYRFLSGPLIVICSIVTCNQAMATKTSGFEILHARIRRHTSMPNVMSITAKLINFSDENKIMPTVRLDLTNAKNSIIASQTIVLAENPQFTDPALTELAPGQDVQLKFNINNQSKSAHGFQLSLVSNQE